MNLVALRRWTVLLALAPLAPITPIAPLFAAAAYHPVAAAEEAAKAARPRILSAAERAAVALAVDYLERGPEAWAGRLANGSSLHRLGRTAARDEIAARAGPPEGATWTLLTPDAPDPGRAVFAIEFASGLDETLDLRLLDQGGWKIAEVRSTSDPWAGAPTAATAGASTASEPSPTPEPSVPSRRGGWMALLALGIAAGGGAGAFALLKAQRKPAAIGVGAAGAVLALGMLLWSFLGRPTAVAGTAEAGGPGRLSPSGPRLSLGALAPLRAALASGTDRAEIARRLASAPAEPHLKEVQELWRAQQRMAEGDLAGAEAILRAFPEASPYPLADLLRARLSFRRMRRAETGWLFEKAIRHGLDNDGLRLEAGFAEAQTDEEGQAEAALQKMVERGSRLAEPWYVAAQVAASQDRLPEAEAYLKRAWQLEPVPRANLFRAPVMAALVARPALFKVFQLGIPEEVRLPPEGPRHPLPLPAGVRAATCGQALRLDVSLAGREGRDGDSSLLVPGGAEIAPADAVLEDANTWNHHEEARAFAALPALRAQTAAGGGLPPRLLRLALQAGAALSEEHRWNELVALTDPVVPIVETAPADLVRLRAKALHQLGRDPEARELLLRLAKTDLAGRRPATATLLDLSELYAAAGEYDIAIKLIAKADSQLAEPRGEQRRRQLAMDRDLEASYASFATDHFEVRYPKTNRERYARQVAWVLEEERTRLSRYIPLPPHPKRIEVHLFPIKDFYASFAGDVAVVGLFDGKMRVPFGEQRTLHPQIVSILAHELAHALMTDATHGQAPHWMQEGLAQHIETGVERFNPLPDLAESDRRLSFPTVDPILRGFAERQFVGLAYSEAAWAIAFVEARWGGQAIPRLLNSFAAGRTTEQAIQEVTGLSLAGFDRAFWAWGTGEGPRTRALAGRDYEGDYADLENREKLDDGGLRLGRRPDEGKVQLGMSDWHARYLAKTAGVKRRLPPIFALYDKEALPVADGAACGDLAAEARKALADPEAWATPDRDIGDQLRSVYGLIADLGDACQIGQTPEARTLIRRIHVGWNRATETLAPFGVKP